ncbi:hypothetical protein DFH06DRAFT_1352923 [Mycena polygramma]|nr:hypothetical protein DFH06DRAFT_1352923 [Mycena polygramma]
MKRSHRRQLLRFHCVLSLCLLLPSYHPLLSSAPSAQYSCAGPAPLRRDLEAFRVGREQMQQLHLLLVRNPVPQYPPHQPPAPRYSHAVPPVALDALRCLDRVRPGLLEEMRRAQQHRETEARTDLATLTDAAEAQQEEDAAIEVQGTIQPSIPIRQRCSTTSPGTPHPQRSTPARSSAAVHCIVLGASFTRIRVPALTAWNSGVALPSISLHPFDPHHTRNHQEDRVDIDLEEDSFGLCHAARFSFSFDSCNPTAKAAAAAPTPAAMDHILPRPIPGRCGGLRIKSTSSILMSISLGGTPRSGFQRQGKALAPVPIPDVVSPSAEVHAINAAFITALAGSFAFPAPRRHHHHPGSASEDSVAVAQLSYHQPLSGYVRGSSLADEALASIRARTLWQWEGRREVYFSPDSVKQAAPAASPSATAAPPAKAAPTPAAPVGMDCTSITSSAVRRPSNHLDIQHPVDMLLAALPLHRRRFLRLIAFGRRRASKHRRRATAHRVERMIWGRAIRRSLAELHAAPASRTESTKSKGRVQDTRGAGGGWADEVEKVIEAPWRKFAGWEGGRRLEPSPMSVGDAAVNPLPETTPAPAL